MVRACALSLSRVKSQFRQKADVEGIAATIRALLSETTRQRLLGTTCTWRVSAAMRYGFGGHLEKAAAQ
jgi:6-phosphogluconate dehydrogenase (decarboxylating)